MQNDTQTDTAATVSTESMKPTSPFQRFFKKFVTGSYPLFAAAIAALAWANLSPHSYHEIWHADLSIRLGSWQMTKTLVHWIDDALMTLFFFVVGLEIKREFLVGGLSTPKQAVLPIAAAIGGMLVPGAIYALINYGTDASQGWGIPMATDIAFSLAILGALGNRTPFGLKIFLSAFAIADDLGAVLVIAVFYTPTIVWSYFMAAGGFLLLLAAANRLWVRRTAVYVVLGVGLWFCILGSGVHATVAGVLVALFIPARGKYDTDTYVRAVRTQLDNIECEGDDCGHTILLNRTHLNAVQNIAVACEAVETPLQRLEHALQSWIAYLVLPLFALANSGLVLKGVDLGPALTHPVTVGIMVGLVLGKPIGISLFAFLAVRMFRAELPQGVRWPHIVGVSLLGGIGYTMSLFISSLSFTRPEFGEYAKLGIITASVLCGVAGYTLLASTGRLNRLPVATDAAGATGRRRPDE